MRWRLAKKIRAAVGTGRETVYREAQLTRAMGRYDRLRSAKADQRYWDYLMRSMTPADRAHIIDGLGSPAKALGLLMRHDEKDWNKPTGELMDREQHP